MRDAKPITIDPQTILRMIRRLVNFPYPQICRHVAALDLLDLLENTGWPVNHVLADALVRADDQQANELLTEELK